MLYLLLCLEFYGLFFSIYCDCALLILLQKRQDDLHLGGHCIYHVKNPFDTLSIPKRYDNKLGSIKLESMLK